MEQRYGTGREDQISGLHHSGEGNADPNKWRNNAKGAVRLVPASNRQITADYPKPGVAPAPAKLRFMSTRRRTAIFKKSLLWGWKRADLGLVRPFVFRSSLVLVLVLLLLLVIVIVAQSVEHEHENEHDQKKAG